MKRQLAMLLVWLVGTVVWVLQPQVHAGEDLLRFSCGQRIDLGDVPAGKETVKFTVTNVSSGIVAVDRVSGSCTCMDIQFGGGALVPGEQRECTVAIKVQSGARQSSAVFFEVAKPRAERIPVMVLYRGVQIDRFDVAVAPEGFSMNPEDVRQVTVDCDWATRDPIEAQEAIELRMLDGDGVTVGAAQEVERLPARLKTRFVLTLDARRRDRVWAKLSFRAGTTVRATALRALNVPVVASLRIEPTTLLLGAAGSLPASDTSLADCRLECAEGWRVVAVETPEWLRAECGEGRLSLFATARPQFSRGVAQVVVRAEDAHGTKSSRCIQCVVDMGGQ